MWRVALACLVVVGVAVPVHSALTDEGASAADVRSFDPGMLIADSLFYDKNAMSSQQIQQFLDASIGACQNGKCLNVASLNFADRARSVASGTGNVKCEAVRGGTITVAELIFRVQQSCGISAKVILVTLQKEQSLITNKAPSDSALKHAMGMGCPDTAPCNTAFEGLANQIYSGTMQLNTYKASNFGRQPGSHYIGYHPNSACGGGWVNVQNYATAALYNYTPYQPNQAALNNLYGTGDSCSSYGNRNFWRLYTDWFGSVGAPVTQPQIAAAWSRVGGATGVLGVASSAEVCGVRQGYNSCYQVFQRGAIDWVEGVGAFATYGAIRETWAAHGYGGGELGFPTSDPTCASASYCYQYYQGGLVTSTHARGQIVVFSDEFAVWARSGYEKGPLGMPQGSRQCPTSSYCHQIFDGGPVTNHATAGAYYVTNQLWGAWGTYGYESGALGYPTGDPACTSEGCVQRFQGGSLSASTTYGTHRVSAAMATVWANAGGIQAVGPATAAAACSGPDCTQEFVGGRLATSRPLILGSIYREWKSSASRGEVLGEPTADQLCRDGRCTQTFAAGLITSGPSGVVGVPEPYASTWTSAGGMAVLGTATGHVTCTTSTSCYQAFESGGINWSPSTGARATHGVIRSAWGAAGYDRGYLGLPTGDIDCSNGFCAQTYERGVIATTPSGGAVRVHKLFADAWGAAGGVSGPLGRPTGNEVAYGSGYYQTFENGAINWTAWTGAHATYGAIRSAWGAAGYDRGYLGLPTSDIDCVGAYCSQSYERGVIATTPSGGAVRVHKLFADAWGAAGGVSGPLGRPTGNEVAHGSGYYQAFENGAINWSPSTGAHATYGVIRDAWGAGGYDRGYLGLPTGDVTCSGSNCSQTYERGVIATTPSGSAVRLHKLFADAWAASGGFSGTLGRPTGNEVASGSGYAQSFERGRIVWTSSTGARVVLG